MATAKTVKDVSPHEFVKAYAAHLKRSGKVQLLLDLFVCFPRKEGKSFFHQFCFVFVLYDMGRIKLFDLYFGCLLEAYWFFSDWICLFLLILFAGIKIHNFVSRISTYGDFYFVMLLLRIWKCVNYCECRIAIASVTRMTLYIISIVKRKLQKIN